MAISDTSVEAARAQLAALKRAGPEARLRLAFDASRLTRKLFESGLRTRHPEMTEEQLKGEMARLLYGVTIPR